MARVVQRRTPPYLTILFAILFVFATVMAVLFFNKYSTFQEKYEKVDQLRRELANNEQVKRPEIQQMLNRYKKSRGAGGVPLTVVAQLQAQVGELAQYVTGLPNTTYLEAREEVEKTFTEVAPPVRRGLTKHMADFNKQLGIQQAEITKLKADTGQLSSQIQTLQTDLATARTELQTKLQAKDAEIAALDDKFQKAQDAHNQKLADAAKEYKDSVGQMEKQVAQQADENGDLQRKVTYWQKKYENYRESLVKDPIDPTETTRRPDGRILRILPDEALVYINIGSKDRVTEDLRLTVFPYTGIPKAGGGKAVIEVTNVDETVSECRIIQQSKDDPIVPGDLVANLVYDALRTYSFVVEGQFDLDGTGEATMAGNKAIRELVRRYGGRLVKDVAIETDYVILGDPPSPPRKPDDTDPRDAWDLYQERLKSYNRYKEVDKLAEGMTIPRLSGQRFLDLVGYIPSKVVAQDAE